MRLRKATVAGAAALLSLGLLTAADPAKAALYTPENFAGITINDAAPASPYPSFIQQWGMAGAITDVNVSLFNLSHTHLDDVDIALQAPNGDAVMLMSDACGSPDVNVGINLTFDQSAAAPLADNPGGACTGGSYQPSSYDGVSDAYPAPWPTGIGTSLAAFNGDNPNGIWRLWVRDDAGSDVGSIAGGFRVTITTAPAAIEVPLGDTGGGVASPYPQTIAISGVLGVVTDVNVTLNGVSHTFPDDMDVLLVGPQGQKTLLMSDACGNTDVNNFLWIFDDEAFQAMSDNGTCIPISNQPTDFEVGDLFPAPAPVGPYGTTLSVFDGVNPNGNWQLYINDDAGADAGYIVNTPTVDLTIDPPPETTITKHPLKKVTKRKATFEFDANEDPVTFQCKLNSAPWRSCASPKVYENLRYRKHTFQVRAIDSQGTKDPTPAKWVWRIVRP